MICWTIRTLPQLKIQTSNKKLVKKFLEIIYCFYSNTQPVYLKIPQHFTIHSRCFFDFLLFTVIFLWIKASFPVIIQYVGKNHIVYLRHSLHKYIHFVPFFLVYYPCIDFLYDLHLNTSVAVNVRAFWVTLPSKIMHLEYTEEFTRCYWTEKYLMYIFVSVMFRKLNMCK